MATIDIRLLGAFRVDVDGVGVAPSDFRRRHAAALVKLLALAERHRLHREQVIDALWPSEAVDEASPRLHKAAHYARSALGIANAVVLTGEHVALCPGHDVRVDAHAFEELATRALAAGDRTLAGEALDLHGGELLPDDRYEDWAAVARDRLWARYVDLLRLDARWDDLLAIDPGDEEAHLALMRHHAARGDHHAALRQFERLDRALRTELGVAPGPEAVALREQLLAARDVTPPGRRSALVGRDAELATIDAALDDAAAGRGRTIVVTGAPGTGTSSLIAEAIARAGDRGMRIAHAVAARVEGGWAYATVLEGLADLCRRHPSLLDGLADAHREEIEHVLAGADATWSGESTHQRLFVAAGELVRLGSATRGLLVALDDLHDADDSSLRLIHYLARTTGRQGVCFLLGARASSRPSAPNDTLASLHARHAATVVHLGPLPRDAAAEVVRHHLVDPDPHVVDAILEAAEGNPFMLTALARRAGTSAPGLRDAGVIAGVGPRTRMSLQRVAVVGTDFDTDEFVALSGVDEQEAFEHLDEALEAGVIEPTSHAYHFRHALVREALLDELPPHRRRQVHREAARRLIELAASPARIGHHLMQAERAPEAVPYLLRAAEIEAAAGAYRDALALIDAVRPHAVGEERAAALCLRGDLLNALGDPLAASAYREALQGADPAAAPRLRARLARTAVMSGDLETAAAALDGLEADGGEHDADILLARGNYAYFVNDFETAADAARRAERLVLAGSHDWKVLDLVSLQGLLAHRAGEWFDRIRLELRRTRATPDVANAIFDGHLCATEYMLYGPTPYSEVIEVGLDIKRTARRSGALRAEAFAAALVGEAALLSGDLTLAEAELSEARELHRDLGSRAGEAVSLQRLAEVHIARDARASARELLHQALRLARSSLVANHVLQRIYGALVTAEEDPEAARVVVDRAQATLGWDEVCPFCDIMFSVPATIACARCGDLEHAERHLAAAMRSAVLWAGTSWEAGVAEAKAAVALASGDVDGAVAVLDDAATGFERAGQPLDAERCRRRLAAR